MLHNFAIKIQVLSLSIHLLQRIYTFMLLIDSITFYGTAHTLTMVYMPAPPQRTHTTIDSGAPLYRLPLCFVTPFVILYCRTFMCLCLM